MPVHPRLDDLQRAYRDDSRRLCSTGFEDRWFGLDLDELKTPLVHLVLVFSRESDV